MLDRLVPVEVESGPLLRNSPVALLILHPENDSQCYIRPVATLLYSVSSLTSTLQTRNCTGLFPFQHSL